MMNDICDLTSTVCVTLQLIYKSVHEQNLFSFVLDFDSGLNQFAIIFHWKTTPWHKVN